MPRIETKVGMKLKLIRGDDESTNPNVPSKRENGIWIAGLIPVGTVGTVVEATLPPEQARLGLMAPFKLDFGDGFPAKEGYYYGIGRDFDSERLQIVP
jgi:hypothetical protein